MLRFFIHGDIADFTAELIGGDRKLGGLKSKDSGDMVVDILVKI